MVRAIYYPSFDYRIPLSYNLAFKISRNYPCRATYPNTFLVCDAVQVGDGIVKFTEKLDEGSTKSKFIPKAFGSGSYTVRVTS